MTARTPASLFGAGNSQPTNSFGTSAAAAETRHQVQYWLNYNLDSFSQLAKTRFGGDHTWWTNTDEWVDEATQDRTVEYNGYPGIITANYDNSAAFINRIANKGSNTFLDLTPAQQAILVPHFEVYLHAGSDSTQSSYVRMPITMPLMSNELDRIQESGYGRPREIGFKSFEWEDQGNAPGTVGIMFQAKLNLYFSSIGALTTQYATADGTTTFLELISPSSPNRTIGVVVGWAVPPDSIDEIDDYAAVVEAVERQRTAFDLLITGYDMSFTELGGVNITIDYMLSEDARMFAGGLDLMQNIPDIGWGPSERAEALQREIDAAAEAVSNLTDAASALQTMADIWRTAYNRHVGLPLPQRSDGSYYHQAWGLVFQNTSGHTYLGTVDADGNFTERTESSSDNFTSNGGNARWVKGISGSDTGGFQSSRDWSNIGFNDSYDYLVTTANGTEAGMREAEIHEYSGATELEYWFRYMAQREVTKAINRSLTDVEKLELRAALDAYNGASGQYFVSSQNYGSSTTSGYLPVLYDGSGAEFRDITDGSLYGGTFTHNYQGTTHSGGQADPGYGDLVSEYLYNEHGLPIQEINKLLEKYTGEYDPDEAHPTNASMDISDAQDALDLLRQKKPILDLADMFQNIYDKLNSISAVNYVDVPVSDITGMSNMAARITELEVFNVVEQLGNVTGGDGGSFNSPYNWNASAESFETNMASAEARVSASEDATLHDTFTDIQLEQLNVSSYTAVEGNPKKARVCFFYLGDLLSVIYGIFASDMQTIVGPFIYGRSNNTPQSCNLADIAINYDSFSEACVLLFRESWARGGRMPPGRFLDYILEQLVVNWRGMVVEADPPSDAANSVAQTRRATQGGTVDIVQRLLYMEKESNGDALVAPYLNGHRIRLEEEDILPPFENPFNRQKYYCIYASNNSIQIVAEQPNEAADELVPIYWLKYGYNKGIVKNIEFSRMDMEGYAEGIAVAQAEQGQDANAGASQTSATPLAYVFQASVTMLGNTLFDNGQMVYITPNLPGVVDGNSYNMNLFLGLTGYYRVIRTTNVVEDGKFETTIDCIFERARTGEGLSRGETGELQVEY